MRRYTGSAACEGIGMGRVRLLQPNHVKLKPRHVDNPETEIARFTEAKKQVESQLDRLYERTMQELGAGEAEIFAGHKLLLSDVEFSGRVKALITSEQVNAEYAVGVIADSLAEMFAGLEDAYIRERAMDIRAVSHSVIKVLQGCGELMWDEAAGKAGEKWVVCAHDLTPGETVMLDRNRVSGFVTVGGSANSHTAILARSMNIPAVVGVTEEFINALKDGMGIIVDGCLGEVYLEPEESIRMRYEEIAAEKAEEQTLLQGLKGKENVTLDGRYVEICANIGSVDEAATAIANDAGGIGLFRSEFLYLERNTLPTEEEQFLQYKQVLECMGDKRVIIRTLDVGGDKPVDYMQLPREENPVLGCRGIRICLRRPEIFKTQLRALYRASVYGRLGIMFPMIVSVKEVEEILTICESVKEELALEGIAYAEDVELGIMIETPAAAVISDRLAPLVDFFSVGTNDLTQYTLACDRQNAYVAEIYRSHHEGVLRLIEMAADSAVRNGKRIGICGEMAADTSLTERFLRMGITELSVAPAYVLKVRERVRGLKLL